MIWEGLFISTSRYIEKSKFKMLCYNNYAKSCIRVYCKHYYAYGTLNIFFKFDRHIDSLIMGQPIPSPNVMGMLAPDLGISKGNMRTQYLKNRYNFKNAHDSAKRTVEANKRAMGVS